MLTTLWELGSDHHVIAPDLPGFGDSGKPAAIYDPQFFARWLEAFLDAVGVDRAHLVGNSMGGRVALELALKRPERVGKLVLLAPSLAFKRFRQFVPLVRRLPPSLGRAPLRVPRVQARQSMRMLFSRSERLQPTWYEAALDEFQRVFRDPRARVAFFSAAREIYLEPPFGRNGFWPRLAGLSAPALFVWGERDLLVPARFARHVESTIVGAQSIVLSDCGHVPQLERPELTHGIVREFFAESSRRTIPKCS
jgi:pimeloyl-ACP methyl ester carboxylesterase